MLAYFPTLYKDELLYSGIARYHINSGNKTQKQTIEDLFGDGWVCATADLPTHLSALVSKIHNLYSSEQLIREHTLLPYYTHFMSQSKIEQIEMLMKEGTAQGAVHASLGLMATKVKIPKYLQFCRECYAEEAETCEPYWHRSHQLPGVAVCSVHKQRLVISNVECGTQNHKFEFVALSTIKKDQCQELNIGSSWKDTLVYIAEQSASMLVPSCLQKNALPAYKDSLYKEGYLTPKGRVKFQRLIQNLRLFYTDELLHYLKCEVTGASETWLHKIIRTSGEIIQPLRHMLIVKFLGDIINTPTSHSALPFGEAPWPCLNKAAGHYRLDVIKDCKISRCNRTGRPVGTFQCSCGFIYSRTGPDQSVHDRYRVGRLKEFGQIWLAKLREVDQTNLSLRQKAKELGVDPGTVKNQMKKITDTSSKTDENGYKSRQSQRSIKGTKHVMEQGTPYIKGKRVNWDERDSKLFRLVKKAVEQIKNLPDPQRITYVSIARYSDAGDLSIKILRNSSKIPKTKAFIEEQLDTTETFQIRRLVWAATKLENTEGKIEGWKLMKLAGLNPPLKASVFHVYKELIP